MICEFCGEERILDLIEVWPEERAWMFDACCERYHDSLLEDLAYAAVLSPVERIRFLEPLRDLFAGYGIPLRQAFLSESEIGSYRMDFGLELRAISLKDAKQFITNHHEHHKAPLSWRWGHAVYNGEDLVAVATVGRPVARMISGETTVEVTRLCSDRTRDPELVWNASSTRPRPGKPNAAGSRRRSPTRSRPRAGTR